MIYGLVGNPDRSRVSTNFNKFKYFHTFKFGIIVIIIITIIIIIVFVLSYPSAGQLSSDITPKAKNKNTVIKSSSYNFNNVTLAIMTHKRCTADAIDFSAPSPVSHSHAW